MKNTLSLLALLLLPLAANADTKADPWQPLQFLTGTWAGEGKAESAAGKGVTTFTWEVGHQVLMRRDRTEFAATADHAAYTYEALMVIYKNPATSRIEASYFDGANHVIHYQLAAGSAAHAAQFVSDAPGGPVFRLNYTLAGDKDLTVLFEMQPPGGNAFHTIATGVVHKQ